MNTLRDNGGVEMEIEALKAEKPVKGREAMEKTEDWVVIYRFKTEQCRKGRCKLERECWGYHSPADWRRVPVFDSSTQWFNYFSKKCGITDWHPDCGYAHNTYELSFHPLLYRTKLCHGTRTDGVCSIYGKYCGFAHAQSELRTPAVIYPLQVKIPPEDAAAWTLPPLVQREVESGAVLTPDFLFRLYQIQGAYEAALQKLTKDMEKLKNRLYCQLCRSDIRAYLFTCCGRGVCSQCRQGPSKECPFCMSSGQLIALSL